MAGDEIQQSDEEEVCDLTYEQFNISEKIHSSYRKLKKVHASLKLEFLNLEKEHEALRKEHSTIDTDYMKLVDEFDSLNAKHENLDSEHETLLKKYSDLSSEHEILKTSHVDLERNFKELYSLACVVDNEYHYLKIKLASTPFHNGFTSDLGKDARTIQHVLRSSVIPKARDRIHITPLLSFTTFYIMAQRKFNASDLIIRYIENLTTIRDPRHHRKPNLALGHLISYVLTTKYNFEFPSSSTSPTHRPIFFSNNSFHILHSTRLHPEQGEEGEEAEEAQPEQVPDPVPAPAPLRQHSQIDQLVDRFDAFETRFDTFETQQQQLLTSLFELNKYLSFKGKEMGTNGKEEKCEWQAHELEPNPRPLKRRFVFWYTRRTKVHPPPPFPVLEATLGVPPPKPQDVLFYSKVHGPVKRRKVSAIRQFPPGCGPMSGAATSE
ncbi:hypothetical protein M5K25_011888 [Dendrobium thyrsiflorum]|uniref:FRIGIDA-like protein n=1 Tax=Dendrobium thyrsiflorum TaxID=117978 RepID=A0ABD0V4C8_DENTH